MNILRGTYAALLSGFDDNGAFSPERQRAITAHVAAQRIGGLYVGGSSGEDGLMETDELVEQQRLVADQMASSDHKLIAHVGRPSTAAAIKLAQSAEALGYDAISALPPHTYPFEDSEIIAYYQAIIQACNLPMIVYEIPARTQRALSLETLSRLLSLPKVIGIKFTSTDLFKLSQLRARHKTSLFYYGYDEISSAAAFLGTSGGIGTTYNVLGSLYSRMFVAVDQGDLNTARRLQGLSVDFVETILEAGVIPGCKLALEAIGVDAGPCRAPLAIRSTDAATKIRSMMASPPFQEWTGLLPIAANNAVMGGAAV